MSQLNDLLEMEHRLSHWQFGQLRKYEIQEMVAKIYLLQVRISEYRERLDVYESMFGIVDGYRRD